MEPSTLQYCQQGIWKEIDRVVASDHRLRNRIGFHDQTRNQRLAALGSIERNFATIDLSAASDSVSHALVKSVFRGTKLLRYLLATRSRYTRLPDGRLIALKKFAPMGSSLCFPIETIIFAAICHYVTREHHATGKYSVFGDDIIVPTQCVDDTMLILETLGFSVNREKSFYREDCWFRESCGAEYCDGFDVTPMRVSRKYNHSERDVRITGLIELANVAYNRGFRNLRQFFITKYRKTVIGFQKNKKRRGERKSTLRKDKDGNPVPIFPIPWFSPSSLLADNYTCYHTKVRWNPDFQRLECRVHDPASKYNGSQDESIRYRHWLESTSDRISIGDGFTSEVRKPKVSLQSCWRQKWYELPDQQLIASYLQ
jgi:hypothetical protein